MSICSSDVRDAAARILGRSTDVMTRASLHPVLRSQIEASALQVLPCSTRMTIRSLSMSVSFSDTTSDDRRPVAARRGALFVSVAAGYVRIGRDHIEKDPDSECRKL
jgi:uncharacterized protein YdiU (UPF0061 family)